MAGTIPPLQYIPAGMRTWVTNVERELQQLSARIDNRSGLIPVTVTQGIAHAANSATAAQQSANDAQTTATDAASEAAVAASQIRAQSIFPNSDYETGMEHWAPSGPNVSWAAGLGRDGVSGAVTLACPGDGVTLTELWSDVVPALPDNSYLVTMWVKPVGTVPAGAFSILQRQTQPGGAAPVDDILYTNASALADGVWVQLGPSNTVPVATGYSDVQLRFAIDVSVAASLIIDTVSVILATTGRMLVPGALDAYAIRSPDIATSDDPDRIAFDDGGIFQYVGGVLTSYWIPSEFYLADGTITGASIIGSVITGSVFRTAASGSRVEISGPDPSDPLKKLNINMIGDDPLEINPGGVSFKPSVSGPDVSGPTIALTTPLMGDGGIGRYSTSLYLGSNRRFEMSSNFYDTTDAGNNRSTTIYGDPAFVEIISGSTTLQAWGTLALQYTDLDPDTGMPSTQYDRISINELGVFVGPNLKFMPPSGIWGGNQILSDPTTGRFDIIAGTTNGISLTGKATVTGVLQASGGVVNVGTDTAASVARASTRLNVTAPTTGGLRIGAVDILTWDTDGIIAVKKIYLDTGKTQSISNDAVNNLIWIDNGGANTIQMGTGSGRVQLGGADKFVWGPDGVYAYGQLFLRSAGGAESDQYIRRDTVNNNNMLISGNGAIKLVGASGADLAVTTPSGTPGLLSLVAYTRTVASSANMNVASNGVIARATSSIRAKKDVKDFALKQAREIFKIRSVTYRSKCIDDDKRRVWWGAIAEEVHEVGLTSLVQYDIDGKPDGLYYDRAVIPLIVVGRDHEERITKREADAKVMWKALGEMREQIASLTAQRTGK